MHRTAFVWLLIWGAFLALLVAGLSTAQETEPLSSPLIERERVLYVSLDLIVHQKKRGKWIPASGLKAEDLAILVTGRKVELDSFEDFCPPAPEPGEVQTTGKGASGSASGDGPAPARTAPISYVLYFETGHLSLEGYNLAFDAALDWAQTSVKPEDNVMIITSGFGLRIVRPLRPAGETIYDDIRAAMRGAGADPWAEREGGAGGGRIGEVEGLLLSGAGDVGVANVPEGLDIQAARALANTYAAEDFYRARRSVNNLKVLMTMFDALEGTKNLVLFQSNLRFRPGEQYPQVDRVTNLDLEMRQLVRAANERNVRFYPVVAGGLGVGTADLGDDAMTLLASETGGRVAERSNDLGLAFERVAEDSSCFYRIGFALPARHDGDIKRLQVIVRGGWGFRVRHRQTVVDQTEEQKEIDRVRAAFLDPERATDFAVHAAAAPLFDHDRGARVRVQIEVPVEELLALRAEEDTREARLQIGGLVIPRLPGSTRGQGVMADVDTTRLAWKFASGAALSIENRGTVSERAVVLAEEIDAPPGDYWLVGVVEDELSQTVAAGIAEFHVPSVPSVLGEIHLARLTPGALAVENEEKQKEREGEPKKKKITRALPTLPDEVLLVGAASLESGGSGQILCGICDPEAVAFRDAPGALAPFRDWSLHRTLSCGGGAVPVELIGSRLPVEDAACFLLVDTIPEGSLQPGTCAYEIRLQRPGRIEEARHLEFEVLPSSG